MSANYHRIIESLILLKSEFIRVKKAKYLDLINLLKSFEVDPHNDAICIPDNREIAATLKFSNSKTNDLLKGLLKELVADFNRKPLEIKDYIHKINIHIPFEEQSKILYFNKKANKELIREYTWLEVKLPVTPRIGEEIDLDFLQDAWYNRGCVYNIQHTIKGSRQEIYIEVHPFHNEYYRWQNLKEKYVTNERNKRF